MHQKLKGKEKHMINNQGRITVIMVLMMVVHDSNHYNNNDMKKISETITITKLLTIL